ncbi:endonuclease/exonuclease/phosphatase family protein [Herbiconiux sp. L3-i23]|uniref:endonuclease/exonuclease/phosphatase family protein n=1 Tax=Herbiconiux sp. L3-i23 TaxID=2905871 RepID=UPI002061EB0C|nr:endonuclease/exonuclease/phosphatase family protein [Herbiconiux sp. L3-i23]BDI22656.1 hypothetical protein L3i23_14320 [Herbiconiux sp. L3-i23]
MTQPVFGAVESPLLHLMSWNIRRRMPLSLRGGRDSWERRAPLVRLMLDTERPSVLGVQEALPEQDDRIADALGPLYRRVGGGRNADGTGERCTVYFDSARLDLVRWRQVALSTTPDLLGSRSWGAPMPRIATTVTLRDRTTGGELSVINTHLDVFSPLARVESARQLRGLAGELGPAVALFGDLNARRGSPALHVLTADGGLRDSWSQAERRATPGYRTYSGYRAPRLGPRIDWILVGSALRIRAAGVGSGRFEGYAPSDHEPVHALVELAGATRSKETTQSKETQVKETTQWEENL